MFYLPRQAKILDPRQKTKEAKPEDLRCAAEGYLFFCN